MKNHLLPLTLGLAVVVLAGCQSPPQLETQKAAPAKTTSTTGNWQNLLAENQGLANARWSSQDAQSFPKRIDISEHALILVFDGSVREIPWSVVDMVVEDRTRWYILPGAGGEKGAIEPAAGPSRPVFIQGKISAP